MELDAFWGTIGVVLAPLVLTALSVAATILLVGRSDDV